MRRFLLFLLVVVLALVVGFVVWALFINPAPTVTEQPKAPVARPQRPLQADAEGYYEPGYRFTLSGVRFTRLTLRPEPFVTFTRTVQNKRRAVSTRSSGRMSCSFVATSIESAPSPSTAGSSPDLLRREWTHQSCLRSSRFVARGARPCTARGIPSCGTRPSRRRP